TLATAVPVPRLKMALPSPPVPLKRSVIAEVPRARVPEPVIVPVRSNTSLPPLKNRVKVHESFNVAIPVPLLPLPVMAFVPLTRTFGNELAVTTVTAPVLLSVNVPVGGIAAPMEKVNEPLLTVVPPV